MPGTIGAMRRILPPIIRGKHTTTSAAIAKPSITLRLQERAAAVVAMRYNHAVAVAVDAVAAVVEPIYPFSHQCVFARETDLRR